ncbi:MAG: MFS transporter [Candidatus Zixiibacteriota bacterium]|nr:MAG: MFS transporter [candidate division Zixibacteria bacterium]
MEDCSQYKHKALVITGLGTFLGTLDASIVNVSLPTISRDLATTVNTVGWVVLSYAIAVFSLLMVFGAVSERKGFQFSYRYGYTVFMLGSILCGLSFNIYMLIISRAVQGVGAALLVSVGPALVTRSFPETERGRGLSVIAMVVSTGLMLGPPLGGFIISLAGWRWIFFVNVPVCIVGIYFTQKFLGGFPISDPDKKIHVPGAAALSLGLLLMMISLLLYSRDMLGLGEMSALLAVSGLFFVLFFYLENKPSTRFIGVEIFHNRIFVFAGLAMLLVFISLISVTILLPFYLEEIKALKPQQVGLFLMIIPVCGFVLAPMAGYLSDKVQARIVSTSGATLMAAGIMLFRGLGYDATVADIVMPLLLVGVGMSFFSTPNTSCIMGSVHKYQLGTASGILATIRTLGITLGVGVSVAIFTLYRNAYARDTSDTTAAFIYGYRSVYGIIIFAILLAIVFSMSRGKNLNANAKSFRH